MEPAAPPPTSTVARADGTAAPAGRDAAWLLARVASAAGAPRLTWYAAGGERVELSGAVLANWVTKTANLLVEEFDLGPESIATIDLPAHWRSITWALAAWRVGAGVVLTPDAASDSGATDVVVTDGPDRWAGRGRDVVAVSLAPLARSFGAPLPAGAVDAAAAVMTYGDVLGYVPPADPSSPALVAGDETVPHAGLLAWALAGPAGALEPGARALTVAREPVDLLRDAVAAWARDGSLVVVTPDVASLASSEPARWQRLVEGERIDVQLADAGHEATPDRRPTEPRAG
ncbi:TIGR03089 family protein [Luteimicrobium sp. DT211]|uniref:TIGR03089 family protein n=1 Tax=Luteimicrobium sp. DT211 TaxID=3393412 RepID=UPI003CF0193C